MKLLVVLTSLLASVISLTPSLAQAKTKTAADQPLTESGQKSMRGRGVALLDVDYETGRVTGFKVIKSTGNPTLDQAAMNAFSRHLFAPRTVKGRVRAPMTFTLTHREGIPAADGNAVSGKRPRSLVSEVTSTVSVWKPRRSSPEAKRLVASAAPSREKERVLRALPVTKLVSR